MRIRIGYELEFDCPKPTPMVLMLNVHTSRVPDLIVADQMFAQPPVAMTMFLDMSGNRCTRLVAPQGVLRLYATGLIHDSGMPDFTHLHAPLTPVERLPDETLMYLHGSRYCDTDLLTDLAWQLFAGYPADASRVQAICDYVHHHIEFGYHHARYTRTASEAFREKSGVCRDYAHLAIALCRCMNIPARYCTGYLGDMGTEPPYGEMDFAAWIEVWADGQWYVFDPRNNVPRIGHILIARGRDAADVAISTAFGACTLKTFKVFTREVA